MFVKDNEKIWVYCSNCNRAYDIRKGGSCKCGNAKTTVDENGVAFTIAEDDDNNPVYYDIDR